MIETEKRILSAVLDNENSLVEAVDQIKQDDFSNPFHQHIYKSLVNGYENGRHLSYFELVREMRSDLKKAEELKNIAMMGGTDNLGYWIEKLKDFSKKRKLKQILQKSMNDLANISSSELAMRLENELYHLTAHDEVEELLTPEEMSNYAVEFITRKGEKEQEQLDGIHLGINGLAWATGGAKPGDLLLLAAKTGHGKTAMALNMVRRAAILDKVPTLYLNTEMSKEQIILRLSGMLGAADINDIRYGRLDKQTRSKVVNDVGEQLLKSKLFPYYCPNLTKAKLVSTVKKFQRQQGVKLVVVDYIGRMEKIHPDLKEWQVLEDTIKTCKILAQNEDLAFLVLVQLNDDGTLQAAKRMKNECDVFIKFYELDSTKKEGRLVIDALGRKWDGIISHAITIDKNRDGEAGITIPVNFVKNKQIISECWKKGK